MPVKVFTITYTRGGMCKDIRQELALKRLDRVDVLTIGSCLVRTSSEDPHVVGAGGPAKQAQVAPESAGISSWDRKSVISSQTLPLAVLLRSTLLLSAHSKLFCALGFNGLL